MTKHRREDIAKIGIYPRNQEYKKGKLRGEELETLSVLLLMSTQRKRMNAKCLFFRHVYLSNKITSAVFRRIC